MYYNNFEENTQSYSTRITLKPYAMSLPQVYSDITHKTPTATDILYMRRAITIARRADPLQVSPNPMVGAVLIHHGRVIGEGYHHKQGELHAERLCLASVKEEDRPHVAHSTLYVTLEPCSHHGSTPPCTEAILESGIPKVVVGCVDPNPKVQGRGISALVQAGVEVSLGVEEEACQELAATFLTNQRDHRPYILLKWAESSDGYIDAHRETPEQGAVLFSSAFTQMVVHRLRSRYEGILVGGRTFLLDRPSLTVRHWEGKSPRRIVMAREEGGGDILSCTSEASEWWSVNADEDLRATMEGLYRRGLHSLLVEGGRNTLQRFIDAKLWDEMHVEISPVALGGGIPSPVIHHARICSWSTYDGHLIHTYIPTKRER